MDIATAVRQLRTARDQAAQEVQRLDVAIDALNGGSNRTRTGRRELSASARARIAAAQRARWAKLRASKGNGGGRSVKRTMSPSARAKIAKAQRARWALRRKSAKAAA
jgi:hypothetical protein